ncbi:sulfite oxidase heme-binding subunit YedZ [Dongia soli]|uniref:Protein-methionine-sulfoxide reductase heme-binding subunit MsrQ n=1 Tax=Dongia soli TaxID=600628 RepID=A0ABU5E5X5_9PROT|nr:ferric reductase-like transmembrane domain-containing protein [Dongia soli]MDY0881591.1 ferric reductase-like transmembrane domain-containing protein [Dongia soli]
MLPWYDRNRQFSGFKASIFGGILLPGLWIGVAWALGRYDAASSTVAAAPALPAINASAGALPLGAMPVTEALHQIGLWAVRFLLLSLAVTPFRRIGQWPRLIQVRRMLGVAAFSYAAIHLFLYIVQQHYRLVFVASEIASRIYLTIGFAALLGLCTLAATSTDSALRRLGGRTWQRLHYLVYPITVPALVHFFLQSKVNVTEPVLMSGFFIWLMSYRLAYRLNGDRALSLWHLLGLAVWAGLLTAFGESAWYQFMTGLGGKRILLANLSFAHHIRPSWWVLAAGSAMMGLKLIADRVWAGKKRRRLSPAASPT